MSEKPNAARTLERCSRPWRAHSSRSRRTRAVASVRAVPFAPPEIPALARATLSGFLPPGEPSDARSCCRP
jgi:hypothetical protein